MRLYLSDELAARQLLIDHLAHVIKPLSGIITLLCVMRRFIPRQTEFFLVFQYRCGPART
jgi:hypothetical protein